MYCSRSNKKPCHRNTAVSFNTTSEWKSLPVDVVFFILDKLLDPIDHVRFAAVCKDWRCIAKGYNATTRRWRKLLPMLLIPTHSESEGGTGQTRLLYNVSEGKVYNNVELPVPYNKRCCGCSHGWLATVDFVADPHLIIALLNPFRKAATIRLPPLDFLARDLIPEDDGNHNFVVRRVIPEHDRNHYETYVSKVILSDDPNFNPETYMVVAIYQDGFRLAFTKAGHNFWTSLGGEEDEKFLDAIFYKGQLYAVFDGASIVSIDVKTAEVKRLTSRKFHVTIRGYLVESTKGDLFHVRRRPIWTQTHPNPVWSERFYVYKLLLDDNDGTIHRDRVTDIGDEAFFVGENDSFSIMASDFPGCKPNCIYYTDDVYRCEIEEGKASDMGIFNLEDETITQIHFPNPNWHQRTPPAHWIMLPFNGLCPA